MLNESEQQQLLEAVTAKDIEQDGKMVAAQHKTIRNLLHRAGKVYNIAQLVPRAVLRGKGLNLEAIRIILDTAKEKDQSSKTINMRHGLGSSSLGSSIDHGYTAISQLLIEHGAELCTINDRGMTEIQVTALRGDLPTLLMLLSKMIHHGNVTPLKTPLKAQLLQKGRIKEAYENDTHTALGFAKQFNKSDCIDALREVHINGFMDELERLPRQPSKKDAEALQQWIEDFDHDDIRLLMQPMLDSKSMTFDRIQAFKSAAETLPMGSPLKKVAQQIKARVTIQHRDDEFGAPSHPSEPKL